MSEHINEFEDAKNKIEAETFGAFMSGDIQIVDGPYTISYNEDGEKWFYLRYEGEVHSWTYSFRKVERFGEEAWNLVGDNSPAGLYLNDIENYDELEAMLNTIEKTFE